MIQKPDETREAAGQKTVRKPRTVRVPGDWTLEGFFEGQPESRRLFDQLRRFLETLGPVETDVMKTQVGFVDGASFAWVWLPQNLVRNRRRDTITVTFDLDHRLEHPRIAESVESHPGRWTHHVVIERDEDLDADVRQWLHEAHDYGVMRARNPRARPRRKQDS